MSDLQSNTESADTLAITSNGEDNSQSETSTNGKITRKFKKLKPEEVGYLAQFLALLPDPNVNSTMQFSELPRELKLVLLPISKTRLVERELIDLTYNDENGAIETATINAVAFNSYKRILEEEVASPQTAGVRASRSKFANPQYKIRKMVDTNPHRQETRRWHTWELYADGDTIDEVRTKDYDRNIKLYTGKWFNGPDRFVIEQDIGQGYLAIYDSTLKEFNDDGTLNESFWVCKNPIERVDINAEETLDEQEISEES